MKRRGETASRFGMAVLVFCGVAAVAIFGIPALGLAFFLSFTVALFMSVRAALRRRPEIPAYAALATCCAALILVYGLNVGRRVAKWNFESRLARRAEIVEMARKGRLIAKDQGPCDCFYAALPEASSTLSAGGVILVSRHRGGFSVTFFVARRGMFDADDYTAFVFRSDEEAVTDGNLVSSRKPQDIPAFNRAMIELFSSVAAPKRRTA